MGIYDWASEEARRAAAYARARFNEGGWIGDVLRAYGGVAGPAQASESALLNGPIAVDPKVAPPEARAATSPLIPMPGPIGEFFGEFAVDPTNLMGPGLGKVGGILGATFIPAKVGKLTTQAKAMAKAGADPREIWAKTQRLQGPDKIWRQEIDDSGARIRLENMEVLGDGTILPPSGKPTAMRDVLDHPELYASEPYVADIPTYLEIDPARPMQDVMGGTKMGRAGFLGPGEVPVKKAPQVAAYQVSALTKNLPTAEQVTGHESQHVVQLARGMTGGGSPAQFRPKLVAPPELQKAIDVFNADLKAGGAKRKLTIEKLADPRELQRLNVWRLLNPQHQPAFEKLQSVLQKTNENGGWRLQTLSPFEQYRRLYGEAEAEMTANRWNLNKAERAARFPHDDLPPGLTAEDLTLAPKIKVPKGWKRESESPLLPDMESTRRYTGSALDTVKARAGIPTERPANPFFDTSDRALEASMEGVEQSPLLRLQPRILKSGEERWAPHVADLLDNRRVRSGLGAAINNGRAFRNWYGVRPLNDYAIGELGVPRDDLRRLWLYQANASQRSDPEKQLRAASYHWVRDRSGLLIPERSDLGYGHLGEVNRRAETIRQGADLRSPKMQSYDANFGGNWMPGTMDTHAVRLPVMLSEDPRWLETQVERKLPGGGKEIIRPRDMFNSGQIDMRTALANPTWWQSAPEGAQYGAFERLWSDAAQRAGLVTAQGQAAGWLGGGGLTGLRGQPKLFIDTITDAAIETAHRRGLDPRLVLDEFLRGNSTLLGPPL